MVNLRIATAYIPPFFDKDGRGQPTGFNSYRQYLQIVPKSGINATYVYNSTLGNYENGTYDGLAGLVYNNLADTSLIYYPIDAFPPPGKFGPAMTASEIFIVSRIEMTTGFDLDFLSCLDIFGQWINISILVSMILVALTLTKHHTYHSIIAVISQMSKQNFSHLRPVSILPHLAMLLWLLFIHAIHGGLYTTNSFVVQPPKRVEELADIITQNKTPIWWRDSPVKKYFQVGATKEAAAVWRKASRLGSSNCVISNTEMVEKLTDEKQAKQISMILAKNSIDGGLPLLCQLKEKEVVNGSIRFYRSKPIITTLSAAIFRTNLAYEQALPVKTMVYNMFEFGIVEHFEKGQLRDMYQDVHQSECSRKLLKSDAEDEPVADDVNLDHVLWAILLFLLALITIGSIFILELYMSSRRKCETAVIEIA